MLKLKLKKIEKKKCSLRIKKGYSLSLQHREWWWRGCWSWSWVEFIARRAQHRFCGHVI